MKKGKRMTSLRRWRHGVPAPTGKGKSKMGGITVASGRIISVVVEKMKAYLAPYLSSSAKVSSPAMADNPHDAIYRSQIALAQEFLNDNRTADLSRVKCLLHKLLPREYRDYIEQLHERKETHTVINIMGGQNIIAPNATEATQFVGMAELPQEDNKNT